MLVNVFDTYTVIKDSDNHVDFDEDMLEKLDTMLDQVGIAHAWCEPRTEDIEKNENCVVTVMYKGEDEVKFTLTYALFCKTYRDATDEEVRTGMRKYFKAV